MGSGGTAYPLPMGTYVGARAYQYWGSRLLDSGHAVVRQHRPVCGPVAKFRIGLRDVSSYTKSWDEPAGLAGREKYILFVLGSWAVWG